MALWIFIHLFNYCGSVITLTFPFFEPKILDYQVSLLASFGVNGYIKVITVYVKVTEEQEKDKIKMSQPQNFKKLSRYKSKFRRF